MGWVDTIHLMQMAMGNIFAPIAFLFRREFYDKIGGFNENYPVLGDWDFNLRFLLETDIGIIPERLANYHHRDQGEMTALGNSVIAGRDKHLTYSSIVRNNFARDLLQSGNPAIATLIGMGLHFSEQSKGIRDAANRLDNVDFRLDDLSARVTGAGKAGRGDDFGSPFRNCCAA